jgi:probable rRNA maturation factor
VKIIIKNLQKKLRISPTRIRKAILEVVWREAPLVKTGEITVSFVTDSAIRALNKKYLKKNHPTDVLAFDLGEGGPRRKITADIVVSTDTAARNAAFFKTTPEYELRLYCIHGVLHILGYDDHSSRKTSLMRKKERLYVD